MESRTDPQFQNNDPYPHVLTLTCEEESCSLRLFPPIPLQSDEEAMSMARRRQRLLSLSTQLGLLHMRQRSSARRESPQKGSRHFHIDNNDEEGAKPNTRPTSNGTNECHSDGEDSSLEHGYDESGYSLPNRQQPGQIHHRPRRTGAAQRRMSIQTPFLTGSLVSDDDEDWNSRFQRVIDDLIGIGINTHTSVKLKAYEKLRDLTSDFNDSAKKYAKIIISEVRLPDEAKTIKPVYTIPGLAGGKKFIVHQILFKFAVDTNGIYGSDENAAKVANHDLKSLVRVLHCWEPGVHLPLMTLVDYRGYRVVCMSLLPINKNTLIHGSCDAGRTIHFDEQTQERLQHITQTLNLREHQVRKTEGMFSTPVDLEAHIGKDGRLYLVDFGFVHTSPNKPQQTSVTSPRNRRLYPPQDPHSIFTGKNRHLYQLFRPEFVIGFHRPLCSDGFSSFIQHQQRGDDCCSHQEEDGINKEIIEATQFLQTVLVPSFVKTIIKVDPRKRDGESLVLQMHEHGINTRYLGLLYFHMEHEGDRNWMTHIFVEMVSRTVKSQVRLLWREAQFKRNLQCLSIDKAITASYFNVLLGRSDEGRVFWKQKLVPAMELKYPPFKWNTNEPLLQTMIEESRKMGLQDVRCLIFKNTTRKLGIRLMSITWEELSQRPNGFERAQPLTATDITDLSAQTKEMDIANIASGFVLKARAMMAPTDDERQRLLTLAVEKFSGALQGNPNNQETLQDLGECYAAMGRDEKSWDLFTRATVLAPDDTVTWFKFAISLVKQGRSDEAEECFLRSLEACPMHSNCCFSYADFLVNHRKNFADAELLYKRALLIDPNNATAANNYAVFLATVRHNNALADHMFRVATTHSTNTQNAANYAAFLYYVKHDQPAAQNALRTQSPSALLRVLAANKPDRTT